MSEQVPTNQVSSLTKDEREIIAHCVIMLTYLGSNLGQHDLVETFSQAIREPLERLKAGPWK